MNLQQLGRQAKALHRKAYGHVDDATLGRALKARFPGLYDHIPDDLDSNTMPETPGTLKIQLQQMADGLRRCVFVARGSKVRINAADYGAKRLPTPAGDFYYDSKAIKPAEIQAALREHRLAEILGDYQLGYGAPDKTELRGNVQAVVARDAAGETAHSALTDPERQGSAIAAAQRLTPPGGAVSVEPPEREISHRAAARPEDVEMPDSSTEAAPLKLKRHPRGAR